MNNSYQCDSNLIPWGDHPSQMTNNIAFELGRGDYPRFYDMPRWAPNVENFKYAYFFEWSSPVRAGGRHENGEYYCNWYFYGSLKEEFFINLEQKRHYIRGVINSYLGNYDKNSLSFCFANSFQTRDRVAKWADEILKDRFGEVRSWSITKSDCMETCPAIARLNIEGDCVAFLLSSD